jgi:organic radical activating enzyme
MLKVHEIFDSIQGEGSHMGKQMTFVRLYGCNRTCDYCDQPQPEGYSEMTPQEIFDKCSRNYICLTGGEPLMQDFKDLEELYDLARWGDKHLHYETNGDFDVGRKSYDERGARIHTYLHMDWVACSPKCKPEELKLRPSRIDDLKIIVSSSTTIGELQEWDNFFKGIYTNLWVQPCNSLTDVCEENLKACFTALKAFPNWHLSPQLHKLLKVR